MTEAVAVLWALTGVVALSMRDMDNHYTPGHYMAVMADWFTILLGPVGVLVMLSKSKG